MEYIFHIDGFTVNRNKFEIIQEYYIYWRRTQFYDLRTQRRLRLLNVQTDSAKHLVVTSLETPKHR